jgi:F-type H+-transporting ATPase subunit c
MKRNLARISLVLMAMLFSAVTTFAADPGAATEGGHNRGLGYIAAGVGFALAAGLAALGQGRVAAAACEGMARNPTAYNRIQLALILGLALIESLVILTFVIMLLKVPNA